MSEKFMSGIEEGRLDKPKDEACLLLYFAKIKVAFKAVNIYTNNIYVYGGDKMQTAKLFQNGSSQAVRLPKEFRILGNEVKIFKKGSRVILEPIETTWDTMFESLSEFPEDFTKEGRNQPGMQKRESF